MRESQGEDSEAIGEGVASVLNRTNRTGEKYTYDQVEKESGGQYGDSDDDEEDGEEVEKYGKSRGNQKRPARISTGGDGIGSSSSDSDSDSESDEEVDTEKKNKKHERKCIVFVCGVYEDT